jgi:hypothetical protein
MLLEKPKLKKQWTVIAVQNRATSHFWRPNRDCPTGTGIHALSALRRKVKDGEYIMAQRKVGHASFELVLMKAGL